MWIFGSGSLRDSESHGKEIWQWFMKRLGKPRQGYLAVGHGETLKAKARIKLRDHEEEDEMGKYSKGSFYWKY